MRVTAQLVDATTDHHLWAERYDRSLQDIFALQDEIRQKIMFALKVKLVPEEQAYFQLSRAKNLDAYELVWRAREVGLRYTKEGMAQARQLCEQALALDPQYAGAYASLSSWYMAEWQLAASEDPQTLERAFEAAQQAIVLDDTLPFAHTALGDAYKMKGQLELAITEGQKSVTLGPNCFACYGELAEHLMCARQPPEEILPLVEKALRLNPREYRLDYYTDLAMLYRQMGRHDEAITKLKQILLHNPTFGPAHRELMLNYVDLGREEEAKREVAELLKLMRPFTLEQALASGRKRWAICIERDLAAYARDTATFRRLAAEVEKDK